MTNPTAQAAQAGSREQLEMPFRREHGIHTFTTHNRNINTGNGDKVSVISHPDADTMVDMLGSIPSSTTIVFTPELATSDIEPGRLPDNASEIREQEGAIKGRINKYLEFSGKNPGTVVVLGTAMFNGESNGGSNKARPRPTNSLLFMREGKVAAHTNQQFSPGGVSDHLFSLEQTRGGRTVRPNLAGIVGADLIGEGLDIGHDNPHVPRGIGNFAETVLVSSGVTLSRASLSAEGVSAEEQMELLAARLFEAREHVSEIIIADRVPGPEASGAEGPLNAHFVRPQG